MKERGWVQEGHGLTVVDFVVMDVTERALRRVVGRMSHRVSVSLQCVRYVLVLVVQMGWEWAGSD